MAKKLISLERLKEYDAMLKDYILKEVTPEVKYKDYVIAEGIVVGIDTETGVAKVINPKDAGLNWNYSDDLVMLETVEYNGVTYNVTIIAENAFTGCSCDMVTIPTFIESIEEYAFYDANIKTLVFEYSATNLTDANIGREAEHIQHLVLNRNITGNYAFAYCTELQTVEIGETVTAIGNYAFAHCMELQTVEIGETVTAIGNYAFAYCTALQTIVFYPSVPPIFGTNCFWQINSVTIYVPQASIQNYQDCQLPYLIDDIDWQVF